METCETCRFRRRDWCCRFPPYIVRDAESRYYPDKPMQPYLPAHRWCGEYSPTPTGSKETGRWFDDRQPDGRHHVDTSMESGPNNCFHCERSM